MGKVINLAKRRQAYIREYVADLPTPMVMVTLVLPWKPSCEVTPENYQSIAAEQCGKAVCDRLEGIISFEGGTAAWMPIDPSVVK